MLKAERVWWSKKTGKVDTDTNSILSFNHIHYQNFTTQLQKTFSFISMHGHDDGLVKRSGKYSCFKRKVSLNGFYKYL